MNAFDCSFRSSFVSSHQFILFLWIDLNVIMKDHIFAPDADVMYGPNHCTYVDPTVSISRMKIVIQFDHNISDRRTSQSIQFAVGF